MSTHFGPGKLTAAHSRGFLESEGSPRDAEEQRRFLKLQEGAPPMKIKRTGNKNRNRKGVGRKPATGEVKTKDTDFSPWLKIFEEGETREDEWLGELCAPKSLPLSTRRKR